MDRRSLNAQGEWKDYLQHTSNICLGFCTDDTQMFGGGLHHPDVLVGKAVASRKAGKMFLIPRNGQIQRNTSPRQLRLRNSNQRFCSHKKKHFYAWIFVLACGWRQWQHQTTLETWRLNTRHQITLKKDTVPTFFSLNFCQAWGRGQELSNAPSFDLDLEFICRKTSCCAMALI